MRFERYRLRTGEALTLRQITDEIMFEIRELSGQEYVHRFAKRDAGAEATAVEESVRVLVSAMPALAAAG